MTIWTAYEVLLLCAMASGYAPHHCHINVGPWSGLSMHPVEHVIFPGSVLIHFECHYGSLEIPWDRWFGSFHGGTEDAHERMSERRKRMHAR